MIPGGFGHQGRLILARFGGVNERSLRLLSVAARRAGVALHDVPELIVRGDAPPAERGTASAPFAGAARTADASVPTPMARPPTSGVAPVAATLPTPLKLPKPPRAAPALERTIALPPPPRVGGAPAKPSDAALASARPAMPGDSRPAEDEIDPAARTLKTALIIGAIAIVTLVLGLGSVWMLVMGMSGASKAPAERSTADAGPASTLSADRSKPRPSQPTPELYPAPPKAAPATDVPGDQAPSAGAPDAGAVDPIRLVRELSACAELTGSDPSAAVATFGRTNSALGACWPNLPDDQLARAQDAVVELVYRLQAHPDRAAEAAAAIAKPAAALRAGSKVGATDVLPAVWSAGLCARLGRERDLPGPVRAQVEAALDGLSISSAGTFGGGAVAAVAALPAMLARATPTDSADLTPVEPWRRWVECARAVSRSESNGPARYVLGALEAVMLTAPEPTHRAVVGELVRAVPWRAGSDARTRLVKWFDNPGVSGWDLNAVTSALVAHSAAEGVDLTMVLAPLADDPTRRELRERFATVWQLRDQVAQDALRTAWAEAAQALGRPSADLTDPTAQLGRAVVLSRLSEAAGMIWSGQTQGAADLIRDASGPVDRLVSSLAAQTAPASLDENASDGVWAIKYLAAEKNIPARAALLEELKNSSGALGPVDAEVLIAEAFRGAPTPIRVAAHEVAARYVASPALVNAALEQCHNVPKTNENADLIGRLSLASLPELKDPSWRTAVRRGLVERLLQMVAAKGDQGAADALAGMLSDSYARRTIASPGDKPSGGKDAVSAEQAARTARQSWAKWAQALSPSGPVPISLPEAQRRAAARAPVASGLVQQFAAEQAGLTELMAYVTAVEHPSGAAAISAVLERLGDDRRRADHVFTQILAAERAMIEIWAVRLEVQWP